MTHYLRRARGLTASATLCTASAIYLATTSAPPLLSLAPLYVAGLLVWCSNREYAHARTHRFRALIAEQAARGRPIDPRVLAAVPCCDLSGHADHKTHGPDCLRLLLQTPNSADGKAS